MRPAAPRLRIRTRNALWSAVIFVGVAAALLLGWLRPIDDVFAALRFRFVEREASQGLTIVEIDSRSLKAAGAWPWNRQRYAKAIGRLTAAGATLVVFDIDFSAPSNAEADNALAAAISRRPGQVALASFVQAQTYGSGDQRLVENKPFDPFTRDSLLASVNVPVDRDGKVRSYNLTSLYSERPSVGALMAGAPAGHQAFRLDFGIDHRSIPHLSFEDVLNGRFDARKVNGRVVLIGATALELGDEFATPSGLIPGVFIHGLAFESLAGGRDLKTLHPFALLGLCGLLGLLLLPRRDGGRGLKTLVLTHAGAGSGILILPVVIQALFPISLDVAPLLVTQLMYGVWATKSELSRRAQAIVDQREAGLLHLAMHQPETGLPNRRALLKHIDDTWRDQPAASIAVITVGVERYAEMRAAVGFNVANSLISQLAGRMADLIHAPCVAHISTSVLAFPAVGVDLDRLKSWALRLDELETNFEVEGHSIDIFLRIGAALESGGPRPAEVLLERSTAALDQARRSEDRVVIYDEAVFGSPSHNLALMTEMRRAMGAGEISLYYQPKKSLGDGSIASAEALCRWNHPERGFIPPDTFIPIAEETGQIRDLTEWSLARAIEDQSRLAAAGFDLTIALNISGRLLADSAFRQRVLELTRSTSAKLCFEITETAVILNPSAATEAIAEYRRAGIKVSIDDYGSGLSSLGYLKMLHADELKIDKSLVVDLLKSQRDRLIMKSTIDLAHGLGMQIVAEGVESAETAACLSLLGCDVIQGYWISKPLPAPSLLALLAKGREDAQDAVSRPKTRSVLSAAGGRGQRA